MMNVMGTYTFAILGAEDGNDKQHPEVNVWQRLICTALYCSFVTFPPPQSIVAPIHLHQ